MTEKDFCFWLQGFFELKKTIDCREGASPETMQVIEDHLKLVFDKKTPDIHISAPSVNFTAARDWTYLTKATC